jgi:hypothetical protein
MLCIETNILPGVTVILDQNLNQSVLMKQFVIFPAPYPSGLNLKTYPEDQVIEESKYILVHFFLSILCSYGWREVQW